MLHPIFSTKMQNVLQRNPLLAEFFTFFFTENTEELLTLHIVGQVSKVGLLGVGLGHLYC